MKSRRAVFSFLFLLVALVFLFAYPRMEKKSVCYYVNQGYVFGTYYNIRYSHTDSLHREIRECLSLFDGSLSTFNSESTISRINKNEQMSTDLWFEQMYETAHKVSILSNGAFDITVAPLVNAWGFGFKNKEQMTSERVDSLLQYVGYQTIALENHQLRKQHPQTMLDASAIAKGQSCDIVAQMLAAKGCENYLVDIGGEVVCKGVNDMGSAWKIAINKPYDDLMGTNHSIERVVASESICMATSGNYRQFYYDNGVRRSHTIDPRTGYPVQHNLLSATIIAPTCMEADALATACMVLGKDSAYALISGIEDTECLLIYTDERDSLKTITTPFFPQDFSEKK